MHEVFDLVIDAISNKYREETLLERASKLDSLFESLTFALRDLFDEQNGAPLARREKQWQEAHDKAIEILKKTEPLIEIGQ